MSKKMSHEFIRGLPGPLPAGERILWRGSPRPAELAWRVFHVREALTWFAVVGTVRTFGELAAGDPVADVIWSAAILIPICLAACALLGGMAWASARTTIYTVTNKRVVLRIGIALPLTVNIPHSGIAGAVARLDARGAGDVGLKIGDGTRLAWFVLWPHCRPWHVRAPEPTMRALPDAARLANILSEALATVAREEGDAASRATMPAATKNATMPSRAPGALGASDSLGAAV